MVILIIISALILLSALVFYVVSQSRGFRSVYYSLGTDKLTQDLKIAMLCDLHNKDYGNENDSLVEAIDAFAPDLVCFAGDMVTSAWDKNLDYTGTLAFIGKLAEKYPVYYGMGNHEEAFREDTDEHPEAYARLKDSLDRMGVKMLNNEQAETPIPGVVIYGLNLPYEYYRRVRIRHLEKGLMQELLGTVDPDRYSILLAHHPDHFEDYAGWGPDLVLSGHVHGGIICLPLIGGLISPGIRLFPKYDFGLFEKGKTTMLLSRGIGSHTIPIRINNKAEIVCLTIKGEKHESQC